MITKFISCVSLLSTQVILSFTCSGVRPALRGNDKDETDHKEDIGEEFEQIWFHGQCCKKNSGQINRDEDKSAAESLPKSKRR